MTTIANYFEQAQLSLAAYALDLLPGAIGKAGTDKLQAAGMSATQAATFAATYTVVAQSGGIGSLTGFSATLFQNSQTGQKYLSIRGTELGMGLDLWAGAMIAFGNPLLNFQIPVMLTFYNQLKTDGLITSADSITVSGHSLGGYLAQLLTMYDSTQFSHTLTYNAPGFSGVGALAASLLGLSSSAIPAQITNVQGSGPNIIAGLGSVLGNEKPIFTESTSHSIIPLTDTLAVYNLLATIDSGLNLDSITGILKASSNVAANTLESVISDMGKLFQVTGTAGFTSNEFDSINGRDLLYTALKDITAAIPAGGGLSLVAADSSILTNAQASTADATAYRYGLVSGNPFALLGAD